MLPEETYMAAQWLIEPQYRSDFHRFIRDGESSESFYHYVDSNKSAQEAIDMVLRKEAERTIDFARQLRHIFREEE
ncbi:hypothetical protein GOV03_04755 [Candidatus Woesearchaeota archaeon]|nr:hypothetical protein [Candidatus Woesearchaeota archaeon]